MRQYCKCFLNFYFLFRKASIKITQGVMGNQTMKYGVKTLKVSEKWKIASQDWDNADAHSIVTADPVLSHTAASVPRVLPPVKMLKDLQLTEQHFSIEDVLLQRIKSRTIILQQTLKVDTNLTNQHEGSDGQVPQVDILRLLEEEIDNWVEQKIVDGQRVCPYIDRGKLFKRLNINLANFVKKSGQNVKQYYQFKNCLGEGSYGKVYRVICKKTSQQRAIKVLKRKLKGHERQKSSFLAEFDLLSQLSHPNIVKLYQIYYYKGYYYVVMQFCGGGSLIDLFKKNKQFSETTISHIMRQLLSALAYLEGRDIVHRDIKLDNLVALKKDSENGMYSIKIIDFGTAVKISGRKAGIAGTRYYMAPEAFKGQLNVKSDVWAVGVILFMLYSGKFPFQAGSLNEMEHVINFNVASFSNKDWKLVSQQAKSLVMKLLERKVRKRPSAMQALKHEWFKKTNKSSTIIVYQQSDLKKLQRYQRGNNFVAVIENYISMKQISQLERDRLGQIFRQIDCNHDGFIQHDELVKLCGNHFGVNTDAEVKKILKETDHNQSGKIDFNQFLVAMCSRQRQFLEDSLKGAFNYYDMNGDGFLERSQILQLLSGCDNEEVEYLLSKLDKDGDRKVSLTEFLNYMNKELM